MRLRVNTFVYYASVYIIVFIKINVGRMMCNTKLGPLVIVYVRNLINIYI